MSEATQDQRDDPERYIDRARELTEQAEALTPDCEGAAKVSLLEAARFLRIAEKNALMGRWCKVFNLLQDADAELSVVDEVVDDTDVLDRSRNGHTLVLMTRDALVEPRIWEGSA